MEFAQKHIDAKYSIVSSDKKINLEVKQTYVNEVPLTVATRDVTDITYNQFKSVLENWYNNSKGFNDKATVTNPEVIDGCDVTLTHLKMPMTFSNRSFVSTNYNIPFADSYLLMVSGLHN